MSEPTSSAKSEEIFLRSLDDFPVYKLRYPDLLHDLADVYKALSQNSDLQLLSENPDLREILIEAVPADLDAMGNVIAAAIPATRRFDFTATGALTAPSLRDYATIKRDLIHRNVIISDQSATAMARTLKTLGPVIHEALTNFDSARFWSSRRATSATCYSSSLKRWRLKALPQMEQPLSSASSSPRSLRRLPQINMCVLSTTPVIEPALFSALLNILSTSLFYSSKSPPLSTTCTLLVTSCFWIGSMPTTLLVELTLLQSFLTNGSPVVNPSLQINLWRSLLKLLCSLRPNLMLTLTPF